MEVVDQKIGERLAKLCPESRLELVPSHPVKFEIQELAMQNA
jgi:hypothetical protein